MNTRFERYLNLIPDNNNQKRGGIICTATSFIEKYFEKETRL